MHAGSNGTGTNPNTPHGESWHSGWAAGIQPYIKSGAALRDPNIPTQALADIHLKYKTTGYDSTQPEGTVLRQTHRGEVVDAGTVIELVVAQAGLPTAPVPTPTDTSTSTPTITPTP